MFMDIAEGEMNIDMNWVWGGILAWFCLVLFAMAFLRGSSERRQEEIDADRQRTRCVTHAGS
jgi:hypothetical protein